MNRNIFSRSILIVVLMVVVQVAIARPLVNRQVETAVLNENWAKVANLLSSVNVQSSSPVLRLIKAHALLARNRNNESLCLFLSVSSNRDLKRWQKWAHNFAARNPRKAVSHYFAGDALARLKQLDAALKTFNQGLKRQATHPLLLNARGVNYAAQEKWNNALIDFYMATKVNSSFADAYANHGTMYIRKNDGANGALNWSNRALNISPDFVLALNTRASANFALGNWEEAQRDFQSAKEKATCITGILANNLANIMEYMSGNTGVEPVNLSRENAGTTLESKFENLKNNPSRRNTNQFINHLRNNPTDMEYAQRMVNDYSYQNPQWGKIAEKRFDKGVKWNSGPAKWITDFFGGLKASVGVNRGPITGGLEYNFEKPANRLDNITQGNLDVFQELARSVSKPPARRIGGVKTKPTVERMDKGNWPFVVNYGLNYK